MIIMVCYAILSFLLDGVLSNYMAASINDVSYFRTIFSIVSLVIMLSYFDEHPKYLYILLGMSILFDIVYTNTFLLNVFLFYVIYFIIDKLNYFIPNNLFMINVKAYLAICLYHIFSYLILMLADYSYYPIMLLCNILLHSIISTVIYATFSYLVIKKIYFKFYNKKIR